MSNVNTEGRGIDILESLEGEITIKGLDVFPSDLDVVELRIIKFVKKHVKTWNNDDGTVGTTNHVRFLAHVYSYKKFSKQVSALIEDASMAGIKVTFDPQAKLLADVYLLNDKFKENGIPLHSRKLEFKRIDEKSQNTSGNYTTWVWKDLGEAPRTESDDWKTEQVRTMIVNDQKANDSASANPKGNTANNAGVDTGAKSPAYRLEMLSDIKKLAEAATAMVADYPAFKTEIYDAFIKRKAAIAAKLANDLASSSSDKTRSEFIVAAKAFASGIYSKPQDAQRREDLTDFACSKYDLHVAQSQKTENVGAVPNNEYAIDPDTDDIPF